MKIYMPGILRSEQDLAFLLRAARRDLGYTLRDMEDLADLHRSSISQWENGHFVPTVASAIKWATALEHQLVLVTVKEAQQWER